VRFFLCPADHARKNNECVIIIPERKRGIPENPMISFYLPAAAALLCASVCTYMYSCRISGKQKSFMVFLLFSLITVLAAVTVRFFQAKYPENLAMGAVLKFCASLPSVLYAYRGYQLKKNRFSLIIVIAIVLGLIADVSINLSMIAGGVFFLVGHLLYDVAFFGEKRPSKKQIILWLVLTTLMIIPLGLFRTKLGSTAAAAGVLLYISILISTVVFSWSLDKMVFAAALVFAFSDCFMAANLLTQSSILMKILALLVYYGSLLLYGAVLWKRAIYER
jgi:hypothetical protein